MGGWHPPPCATGTFHRRHPCACPGKRPFFTAVPRWSDSHSSRTGLVAVGGCRVALGLACPLPPFPPLIASPHRSLRSLSLGETTAGQGFSSAGTRGSSQPASPSQAAVPGGGGGQVRWNMVGAVAALWQSVKLSAKSAKNPCWRNGPKLAKKGWGDRGPQKNHCRKALPPLHLSCCQASRNRIFFQAIPL